VNECPFFQFMPKNQTLPTRDDVWARFARIQAAGRKKYGLLPYPKGVFRFATHEEADAWKDADWLRVNGTPRPKVLGVDLPAE
jgi:hypothetical protein